MTKPLISRALLRRIEEIDWDFSGDRCGSRFSAIHWHPCRFVSQIPAAFIGVLTSKGHTVLDPFLGSGTTIVEAQRLQRRGIGIEINPVAARVAEAKTLPLEAPKVKRLVDQIRAKAKYALSINDIGTNGSLVPESVQLEKWYNEKVQKELTQLRAYVSRTKDEERIISEAIFSSILLRVCREIRHWGYVCDNSTPKGDYGKDVIKEFDRDLLDLVSAYEERDRYIDAGNDDKVPLRDKIIDASIICGDSRNVADLVQSDSVDLVVTSPPYFGVADYVKAQRLSFEWDAINIEPYRVKEIGARSKRHRKQALEQYLADLESAFSGLRQTLKEGAPCIVVFGESSSRAPTFEAFMERMQKVGFAAELHLSRTISQQRRQAPSLTKEHLLVFV